jgi:hypothetical protein
MKLKESPRLCGHTYGSLWFETFDDWLCISRLFTLRRGRFVAHYRANLAQHVLCRIRKQFAPAAAATLLARKSAMFEMFTSARAAISPILIEPCTWV